MFPGDASKMFSMSAKKVYLVSETLGPHFHGLAITDVLASDLPYTLVYDEMTNQQNEKQLDIMIKYVLFCTLRFKVSAMV